VSTRVIKLAARRILKMLRERPKPDPSPPETPEFQQFREEFQQFSEMNRGRPQRFILSWADRYPCLGDRTPTTGFDRHYVYHTAWAARVVAQTRPKQHVDVSSYVYFPALVSAFVPVQFYDYRPAPLNLDNLTTGSADLTALPFPDGSIGSLSCMHVVEHIGLGRYGDPLDPDGDLKAMAELRRVLSPEGNLLFVVPVGRSRVCFNAHRIYAVEQVLEDFRGLELRELALIPDNPADGDLVIDPSPQLLSRQQYGCGCFWFRRRA
jgi:SAM-dependent methyltransferase